jgi:hypothetical protein
VGLESKEIVKDSPTLITMGALGLLKIAISSATTLVVYYAFTLSLRASMERRIIKDMILLKFNWNLSL